MDDEAPGVLDDAEEEERGPAYRLGQAIAFLLAPPLLLVLLLLAAAFVALIFGGIFMLGWAVYHADPGEVAPKADAGYLDLIISNRWVVWGIRSGLLFGVAAVLLLSLFVVMSIVVRAGRVSGCEAEQDYKQTYTRPSGALLGRTPRS